MSNNLNNHVTKDLIGNIKVLKTFRMEVIEGKVHMDVSIIDRQIEDITIMMMNIIISGIDTNDHIITSDNIFTSGFTMKNTYQSIHRGE